jgi:hypothetical protein
MVRFRDFDEAEDMAYELERELEQERRGAAAWERQVEREQTEYERRVAEALGQRDAVQEALMALVDVVEATPFHAYCEWRRRGHAAHAAAVDDWQVARDRALATARGLVF